MANNRMYLHNKRTGAQVLLAKYYPSGGWEVYHFEVGSVLQDAFRAADFTPEQHAANVKVIAKARNPFAGPHKAQSAPVNGAEWELRYD